MLIGSLKVTSMVETAVFRGLGETGVIELTLSGDDDLDGLLGRGRVSAGHCRRCRSRCCRSRRCGQPGR